MYIHFSYIELLTYELWAVGEGTWVFVSLIHAEFKSNIYLPVY